VPPSSHLRANEAVWHAVTATLYVDRALVYIPGTAIRPEGAIGWGAPMLAEHTIAQDYRDRRLLFVVGRDRQRLYDHLREGCHPVDHIDVLFDRRHAERRRWRSGTPTERRQTDRRNWRIDEDLETFGFAVVLPFRPSTTAAALAESRPITSVPATMTFLRDVALFRYLDDQGLAALAMSMREENVPAGATLIREGEVGRRMFVIRDGTLIVSKGVSDKVEKVLVHMKHGEFFGEMSLFTRRLRSASVRALTDAVVLTLDREGLDRLVDTLPRSALSLLISMAEEFSNRLSNTDEMLADVTRWGLAATGIDDEVEP